MSPTLVLLKKELLDYLRDRRTLAVMVLLPICLYPVLLVTVGALVTLGKERLSKEELIIALTTDEAEKVLAPLAPPHTQFQRMEEEAARAAMRDKKVWAAVSIPGEMGPSLEKGQQVQIRVEYTKRHDRSVEALSRIKKVLDALKTQALSDRLTRSNLPAAFAKPIDIIEEDIDFKQDLGPLIASRLLPTILLLMLFMGALYPAIDATAGEKERGTLETLLVAPVRPWQVMTAKYLTVLVLACFAALTNLGMMALTFRAGLSLGEGVGSTVRLSAGQLFTMVLCMLPTAALLAGVALALASLARTFKEAQAILSPMAIVLTVPGLLSAMPGMELSTTTALVPLLNVALLVKAEVLGATQGSHVALVFLSTALVAALAILLASATFQSERLRFGPSGLKGRRKQKSKAHTTA